MVCYENEGKRHVEELGLDVMTNLTERAEGRDDKIYPASKEAMQNTVGIMVERLIKSNPKRQIFGIVKDYDGTGWLVFNDTTPASHTYKEILISPKLTIENIKEIIPAESLWILFVQTKPGEYTIISRY